METEKLSISLPADMARKVRLRVENGSYASNSEVIREGLRLLDERERERNHRLDVMRAKLNEAAETPERVSAKEMRRHFENLTIEAGKKQAP
jgi:antitoxin ParD1/3/4